MNSGLQVKYATVLSLSVGQPFYQNQICRRYQTTPVLDFSLVPTTECQQLMRRMDLLFRNTDTTGGFIVLGRVLGKNGGGDDLLRFPAYAGDKLTFWIILNNPDMLNFDDLPAQLPADEFYYFSNQLADLAAPRTNLHLSVNPAGVTGVNDTLKKSGTTYRFHYPIPIVPTTAKVKHLLSGITVDPVSVINQGGGSDLLFNLSILPLGICQLLISGAPVDFFYYGGDFPIQPVFGIIELSLASSLAANYRIIEADRSLTQQRPAYAIRFPNRSTIWRYTIRLTPNSPLYLEMAALSPANKTIFLNELNIVPNDSAISFTKDSVSDLQIVFKSQNPVALQEKYTSSSSPTHDTLSLTLKKYIGDPREAAVKTGLPYPGTGSIDATLFPTVYSDIFLTL